jgi:hypothetical protein
MLSAGGDSGTESVGWIDQSPCMPTTMSVFTDRTVDVGSMAVANADVSRLP